MDLPLSTPLPELSDDQFEQLSRIIHQSSGIHLTKAKVSLLQGRLSGAIRAQGLESFQDYLNYLKKDLTGEAVRDLLDRISTNHTFFFREKESFDLLQKDILPPLIDEARRSKGEIRIWSAACSSGEEAYSLAILAWEAMRLNPSVKIRILATDISIQVLQKASSGFYHSDRVPSLSPAHLEAYFVPEAGGYRIRSEIRDLVLFKKFNLNSQVYPFRQNFHVVFCRNVMIYFSQATRDALVTKLTSVMAPGSWLFLGLSESILSLPPQLKLVKPSVYRKKFL